MIKINIIKNNQVTNSAKFQTLELAMEWFQRESDNGSFGKPEHQVLVSEEQKVYDEEGNLVETIEAVYETVPSEFTYEIQDITSELERIEKYKQIKQLEDLITNRRVREALLTNDFTFINNIESQIQEIRQTL